ncbi:AAA family ATPase [Hydrogenovibrio marinus]|uniref:Uncharacterized protein n=1 Tax=Hydrogenovibrio marinus TaxID=28885 RepID=A0A066ZSV6_HYDMR|nr:AAA family ATPase [Hydrogenovibrio marinus]KDN96572.1 hypothetical protein EI16_09970 [Hydrogenovibrio marinus]BBN60220.1 hypothetical protein HVMH_1814 [Hydrogenovibrio marinus]
MHIDSISLENFRCFKSLSIDFHETLTVLVASNGGGKTTLLDAARISIWPYVKAFDLGSQAGKSATIQIDDVRQELKADKNMETVVPSKIIAKGTLLSESLEWVQYREKTKLGTNTKSDRSAKLITEIGKELEHLVRNEEGPTTVDLPVVVYLGTGRLWYQGRYTAKVVDKKLNKAVFSRFWGYRDCLTATSSYKQFEDWYAWVFRSYREVQIERMESGEEYSNFINEADYISLRNTIFVIQEAVNKITQKTTGWKDLQYSSRHQQKLVMVHDKYGSLPLDMLSDGIRNIVVLVSDIAFRCIKLNPHLGLDAATKSSGVVLIDEVDMFLHPQWQQRILGGLQEAFPNLQFIVTTHSPQVLSTIPKECIRVLGESENGSVAAEPNAYSYGEPSNDVLQAIMGVDPIPPVAEKEALERLTNLVDQGRYESDEARQLLNTLTMKLHPTHPQLQKIERSINRQNFLAKDKG